MKLTSERLCCIVAKKGDGKLHRAFPNIQFISELENNLIFWSPKGSIIKNYQEGQVKGTWNSPCPAFMIFPLHKYFNVMLLLKEKGVEYYVNLASPLHTSLEDTVEQEQSLCYTDYDLDIVLHCNGEVEELDVEEFQVNAQKYLYSSEILQHIEFARTIILAAVNKRKGIFSKDFYYQCENLKKAAVEQVSYRR